MGTIVEISEQSHAHVEEDNPHHGHVKHAARSAKLLRSLHLVLKGQNDADGFQGEEDSAKEQWEVLNRAECILSFNVDGLTEYIIADDGEGDHCDEVGQGREGCQVLELTHPINEYQRDQDDDHAQTHVHVCFIDGIHNGLDIGGNKHHVDTACAQLIDQQKDIDNGPNVRGAGSKESGTLTQRILSHIGVGHAGHLEGSLS